MIKALAATPDLNGHGFGGQGPSILHHRHHGGYRPNFVGIVWVDSTDVDVCSASVLACLVPEGDSAVQTQAVRGVVSAGTVVADIASGAGGVAQAVVFVGGALLVLTHRARAVFLFVFLPQTFLVRECRPARAVSGDTCVAILSQVVIDVSDVVNPS